MQGQQGFFASDWTQVTVDCPDEPRTGVLVDAPRLATPTFTG